MDYISKPDLMGKLTSSEEQKKIKAMTGEEAYNEFLMLVNSIEKADVAPVRSGRWVPVYESEISGWNPEYAGYDPVGDYRCSLCRKDAILDCNDELVLSPYCPNCGARCVSED